jgi:hypothetical protein
MQWAKSDDGQQALASNQQRTHQNLYKKDAWPIWYKAYSTSVTRRVAENYIMFQRLHAAGIGPKPFGLTVVPDYASWFSKGTTVSAGLRLENLYDLPPKPATTELQMRSAGVIPDASKASLREQINGYISDLNSLRGAMPEDAEREVSEIEERIDRKLKEFRKFNI